jgi:hypothetical protein
VNFQITSNNRTLHDHSLINSYNDNQICGYSANDWSDNRTLDVSGCHELKEGSIGENIYVIFHHDLDNNSLRFGANDTNDNGTNTSTSYPRDLDCLEFSDDRYNPGDTHLCHSSSSSSGGSLYFDNATSTFYDNQRNLRFEYGDYDVQQFGSAIGYCNTKLKPQISLIVIES